MGVWNGLVGRLFFEFVISNGFMFLLVVLKLIVSFFCYGLFIEDGCEVFNCVLLVVFIFVDFWVSLFFEFMDLCVL